MKKLTNLQLEAVALVDRGANPGAQITLFKRHKEETMTDKERLEQMQAERDAFQKRAEAAEAKVAELTKEPDPDPVAKADPVVKAEIEKARQEAAEAKAEIAKMREQSEIREYVAKAAAFPGLGEPPAVGPVLRKIARALTDEEYAAFDQSLTALHKQAEPLFREFGKSGDTDAATPEDRLDRLAKAAVAKSEGKLTYEQAYANAALSPEGRAAWIEEYNTYRRNGGR